MTNIEIVNELTEKECRERLVECLDILDTTERDKNCLSIINHCGIGQQKVKLCEEFGELLTALKESDPRHIAEEMADVRVIMRQIQLLYQIDDSEIVSTFDMKVNRTLKRLKLKE